MRVFGLAIAVRVPARNLYTEMPVTVKIYHNPACSTSRNVLAMVREKAGEPEIVEYLKTPLNRQQIKNLLKALGMKPRELLRKKAPPYAELGLDDLKWSDEELIGFMAEHPVLIERPVVVTDKGARLGRPAEKVLEILP
jgi:arsenate reductase (glutaredoxin)